MTHSLLLGREVVVVQFTSPSEVRNSFGDLDPIGSKASDFQRVVGHQVDFGNSDIAKHVGAKRVLACVGREVQS